MRHRSILVLFIVVATGMAAPSKIISAEDEIKQGWEHKLCELGDLKERLANPPPRDPKIERLDEPYKRSLKNVDPQWIEQKYMAIVRLELPKPAAVPYYSTRTTALQTGTEAKSTRRSDFLRNDATLEALQHWIDGSFLIYPEDSVRGSQGRTTIIERLVKLTPENRRPAQTEIDYLAGDTPFNWSYVRAKQPQNEYQRVFHIPATTPELAERRARALLMLLDQGFSRTLQLALYDKLDRTCQQLQEFQKSLDEHTAEEKQAAKELERYAGFHAGMLDPLRLQQLQLEIELAGVKARIAGCDKVLKEDGIDAERWKKVQELKTAAEIELLVIEARQAKAAEFLTKVKEAGELAAKREQAQKKLKEATMNYYQVANQISRIHDEIRWFAPLPLVDDKIVVQELEWTQ